MTQLKTLAALAIPAVLLSCFVGTAAAADSVWWGNYTGDKISFARLDGSGGGDLATPGTTPDGPEGVAIDAAAGRIYWLDYIVDRIAFANLDGSGGGAQVSTAGATISGGWGLAIHPTAGKVYWGNSGRPTVGFANLDGTGGADLNTTGTTVEDHTEGVAVDPVGGRVYFATNSAISFANIDGSGGGGNLNTTGAAVSRPRGVAVDRTGGRVYWANHGTDAISFANLDGTGGGGNLNTTGATLLDPTGVAVDPEAGMVYWTNTTGKISFAKLDGSGGGDLNIAGASAGEATFPALLKAPRGTGAPVVGGGVRIGSTLSCSPGSWAPDLIESFLYRAVQTFATQWSLDGTDIAGATESTHVATETGDYRCRVTASNAAGSTSQTGAAHAIAQAAFGAKTLVTLRLAARRIPARGPIPVRVANRNDFAITGRLAGRTVNRVVVAGRLRVRLKSKALSVPANARRTVKLALPRRLRPVLERNGSLSLRLTARVRDPARNTRTVSRRVSPKLRG